MVCHLVIAFEIVRRRANGEGAVGCARGGRRPPALAESPGGSLATQNPQAPIRRNWTSAPDALMAPLFLDLNGGDDLVDAFGVQGEFDGFADIVRRGGGAGEGDVAVLRGDGDVDGG